jgi:hypothetical protein
MLIVASHSDVVIFSDRVYDTANYDEAVSACKSVGQRLPSVSSVNKVLQDEESTWIDAVVQKGPWTWRTSGRQMSSFFIMSFNLVFESRRIIYETVTA